MTDDYVSPFWFALLPLSLLLATHALERWDRRRKARAAQVQAVSDRLRGLPPAGFAWTPRPPTPWDRMWSVLLPMARWPNAKDVDPAHPALRVEVHVHVTVADRLRLLLCGNLRLLQTIYTDVQVNHARTMVELDIGHAEHAKPKPKEQTC